MAIPRSCEASSCDAADSRPGDTLAPKEIVVKKYRQEKIILLVLALAGLVYFLAFIPPNLTGAQDATMLSVFQHDEFAQYPHVVRMITPGETPYQSLRNFVVYLHYYYGYPFYFLSALAILPVKVLLGSGWAQNTSTIVAVLRQVINVFPMILSALLLVWLQTRFKSWLRSIVIFVLLLTLPAVVSNNMWWHPDGLLVLFSVLTIFFLARDDFRFGRNFYLSAIPCALAVGVKILGVLFVLAYAVYILYGVFSRRIQLRKAVTRAAIFLGLMILALVITNPLLLLPIERAEITEVCRANLQQNTVGFWVKGNSEVSMFQQIYRLFGSNYTSILLLLVSLAGLVYSMIKKETRALGLVIFTWALGYTGYFLIFASTMRTHYLLPAALPVLSGLAVFLPECALPDRKIAWWKNAAAFALLAGVLVQIIMNAMAATTAVNTVLNREKTSSSINLYNRAEEEVLWCLQVDRKLRIYRDWRAYVAEDPDYYVIYNWDLATYPYIQEINADVIFLERENMVYFSDAGKIAAAIDPARMREMVAFYSDAIYGQLDGYTLALKTDFGAVFVKADLFQACPD